LKFFIIFKIKAARNSFFFSLFLNIYNNKKVKKIEKKEAEAEQRMKKKQHY
jgi:hypothetical protein